jgi:hypothetical protein
MRNVQWLGIAVVTAIGLFTIPRLTAHAAPIPGPVLMQADTASHTLPIDPTDPEAYELALASVVAVGLVQLGKLYRKFRTSSDVVKMLVTFGVSLGVAKLSALIGFTLPGDPNTWTGIAYNAVAVFLTAAGLHAIGKKAITAATTS